ncbi:MAG TPA: hypothetical protein VF691_10450 [Cytophagaceae bacterium]|jgi:hypothetical protein
MFEVVKIYSDADGHSHFEDVSIPLKEAGQIGLLSDRWPAEDVIFRIVEPTYDYDFHTAPQKQFIILLDGEIEIETSLGEKRIFKGGEVLLMEDTEGHGHRTRNLTAARRKSIFIKIR